MRLFIFIALGISIICLACLPPYKDLKFGFNGEVKSTLVIDYDKNTFEIKGSYYNFYSHDIAYIIIKDLKNKNILVKDTLDPITFKSNVFRIDDPIRIDKSTVNIHLIYRHNLLDSVTIGELQYWIDSTYLKLSLDYILGKPCTLDVIFDKSELFKLCAGSDFPIGKVYLNAPENQGVRFLHFAAPKNSEYANVESFVIDTNGGISGWFPKISSHPPIVSLTDTLLKVKYTYDLPDTYYANTVFIDSDLIAFTAIDKKFATLSNIERLCACRNAAYKWDEKDHYKKF
jgi:hypothetical protein